MDQAQIAKNENLDMRLDGDTGLHEILWRFNTLWPDMDIYKKYQLADEMLRELWNQDTVRIIKLTADHDQRRDESIDQSQMDEILRSPVSWYPSLSDDPWSQLAYETTDIGESLRNDYRAREGS